MQPYFGKLPVVVMPLSYELPLGFWKWCKISEVCAIVPNLAKLAQMRFEFNPTPEELISNFAALVRPNRLPYPAGVMNARKKIFRYSLSGNGFSGTEVPTGEDAPPNKKFEIFPSHCFPQDVFVPEGWVIDTLKAIRRGAISATDRGNYMIGFCPKGSAHASVILENNIPLVTNSQEEFSQTLGTGKNMLRTSRLAHPRALRAGDILATGCKVLSEPRDGGNGSVEIHIDHEGCWISVPARIPIALLTPEDNAPRELLEKY
ncbi:MAG: hypothetical protein NTV02_00030 [Candidatus Zambryskibacteria bacterium]|nr:hypothetical protein [Candidatus Zambryskibacteria bacterium]